MKPITLFSREPAGSAEDAGYHGAASGERRSLLSSLNYRPLTPSVGLREALLWSALAHAIGIIVVLLAPKALLAEPGGALGPLALLAQSQSTDDRIPVLFVQDEARPPEPNPDAPFASDRDRRRAQDQNPPNPSEMEPYSTGNTPAAIARGPLGAQENPPGLPSPPSPQSPELSPDGTDPFDGTDTTETPSAEAEGGDLDAPEGIGDLIVRPPGFRSGDAAGEDEMTRKGQQLRQALSQMGSLGSVGNNGGSPFRYHNPTGGLSTPSGSLSFDTKGFDWGPYARRIYWIIWSNWHSRMPPAIYTGLKGAVTVRFVIQKDGSVTGIRILASSDIPAYDSAATLALEASDPLPPLPDNFPKEHEGVTGRFLYNMWRR